VQQREVEEHEDRHDRAEADRGARPTRDVVELALERL
jgi:hypothetical protein